MIFVALALVWAVVLIPKALRHHDEVARTRSVAHVSEGVRVVSRRTGATAATKTDAQPRAATPPRAASTAQPSRNAASRPGTSARSATAKAAARRRRILAVLLLADVLVGAGAVAGLLQPWAPAIPVGLTLLFLVVARITVRREQARRRELTRRRTQARTVVEPSLPVVEPALPVVEPASEASRVETTHAVTLAPAVPPAESAVFDVVAVERNAQGLSVVSGLDDTSSIPVVRIDGSEAASSLWDPLPVTLPTYVTKPRASRSVRTIDLSAPDVSSSGRSSAASALVAEAATVGAEAGGEDDAPHAVGS